MKSAKYLAGAVILAGALGLPAASPQAAVLVAQCVEFATCWTSGAPWSDTLTLAQLTSLGLGSSEPLVANQTSEYSIRLGVTTADFSTTSGPTVESLPEFSGGYHVDPGPYERDVVGYFMIPADATGLTISGMFGNSVVGTSAGVDVYLGAIPEPSTWAMMALGFAGLGLVGYRKTKKDTAALAAG